MTIFADAFKQQSVFYAAKRLLDAGVSVIPVNGKRPAVYTWSQYQQRRMSVEGFMQHMYRQPVSGLAIIGGKVSNNLVVIDLDGIAAVNRFVSTFPDIAENTLTTTSGSGVGMHCYLIVADMPPNVRRDGVEIRGEGCYTVAPPSIHPNTGKPYTLKAGLPVLNVPHIKPIVRWLKPVVSVEKARYVAIKPGGSNPAWVAAAVTRQIDDLRSTSINVNNKLNAVSYSLARICANPRSGLSAHSIQQQIMDSIPEYIARDGYQAARNTMLSGWNAGWRKPAHIPKATNGRTN